MAFNRPHRMQHFQRNTNFVPRGRGHRYDSNYHRPPPNQNRSEENYWCETCDRGFYSPDMLNNHKQQHQQCNIDGCHFIAHPKVITKHIQMQHSTGLFKKIGNLTNPEDIQKWREERKKKYPTKGNVAKKAAELKEKIERGEKMGLKRDKKIKNGGPGEIKKRKYSNNNENFGNKRKKPVKPYNTNHKNKESKQLKKEEVLPQPENIRKLNPFAGILDLTMDNDTEIQDEDQHFNFPIEDDDDCLGIKKDVDTSSKIEEPSVCGALTSLMCEYGSSDEENEQPLSERPKDIPDYKNKDQSDKLKTATQILQSEERYKDSRNNTIIIVTQCEHSNSDAKQKCEIENNCPPEEVKTVKPVANKSDDKEINTKSRKAVKLKSKSNIHNNRPIERPKPNLPSTLLQKLLHREIQQERNIVLQCIRHIVKNNYFDI